MSIEIRVLQAADTLVLQNVASGVFDDPIVLQAAQGFLNDPHHHLVVAIENGIVIGFASALHYLHPDKTRPEFWVNEVGVSPVHQNRGVGKALMQAFFDLARNLGCIEAWVLTERKNQLAMGFYKSLGGEEEQQDTVMFTFHLSETPD